MHVGFSFGAEVKVTGVAFQSECDDKMGGDRK
jgi:hypothetical protein